MRALAPWTEPLQHFTAELRDQFWGDIYRPTWDVWPQALGRLSVEARDRDLGVRDYERVPGRSGG